MTSSTPIEENLRAFIGPSFKGNNHLKSNLDSITHYIFFTVKLIFFFNYSLKFPILVSTTAMRATPNPPKRARMTFMMRTLSNTKLSAQKHTTRKKFSATMIPAMMKSSSRIWDMSQPQNCRVSKPNKTLCVKSSMKIRARMKTPHEVPRHVIIPHFGINQLFSIISGNKSQLLNWQ